MCCALNATTSEIRVQRTVSFIIDIECIVEYKKHLLGKLIEETHIVTIQQAGDVLRRAASIRLCCVAAEVLSVTFEPMRGVPTQSEINGGSLFNVCYTGKSSNSKFNINTAVLPSLVGKLT